MSQVRFWSTTFCVSLFLGAPLVASDNGLVLDLNPLPSNQYRIGERIDDLSFEDLESKKGTLSETSRSRATVILMHKVGCPISARLAPTIRAIVKKYEEHEVAFWIVNAGSESAAKFRSSLDRLGLKQRAILDADHQMASRLRAEVSSDVFVLDKSQTLVYRGPVDDQYGIDYTLTAPRRNLLVDAIEKVLAGERIEFPAWIGPGCSLDVPPYATAGTPTYHGRISRIVQQNCQSCHRPGQNGPFDLMTYDDVRDNAPMIQRVVKSKIMPPWFADPNTGHWSNDPRLSERDQNDLASWIRDEMPEGDPREAPQPIAWVEGWSIGKPDHIVTLTEVQNVPAAGTVSYRHVTVPLDLEEDKWIQKIEIRPSATEVVHHVLVFVVSPDANPVELHRAGLDGFFASYSPGQSHQILPPGQAMKLPKGSQLLFQIHYQPNGVATQDRIQLGMVFSKQAPRFEVRVGAASSTAIALAPGEAGVTVEARHRFEKATRIFSFSPHMHLRGTAFTFEFLYPDGRRELVLRVEKYNFNWQLEYKLEKPIDVVPGTVLIATGHYDNSAANRSNPDPEQRVRFGQQTSDEMMIGYYRAHDL